MISTFQFSSWWHLYRRPPLSSCLGWSSAGPPCTAITRTSFAWAPCLVSGLLLTRARGGLPTAGMADRGMWLTHLSLESYCSNLASLPQGLAQSCHPGSTFLYIFCRSFLCLCSCVRCFSLYIFYLSLSWFISSLRWKTCPSDC